MIRVLHLIKALGRGGAEVLLKEGLAVADRRRFELSYGYLQTNPDDVAKDLRAQGAKVECFHLNGNLRMLLGARRVASFLREQRIDLVHAHLPMAGVVARLAGRLASVPVVYTEHGPVQHYHPVVRRLNALTWSWQDQVIAISEDVASAVRNTVGDSVPIREVWNGVNTRVFDPHLFERDQVRKELGLPGTSPVVGTVAGFRDTPAKRLDLWLSAARRIHEAEPTTHFLLVGDGPLRAALQEQARAQGLGDAVRFAGRTDDVRPFLAAMDVFLMSSAYEGLPVAPLEAMAMQVAVVGTDVVGLRNVVTSGKTGLLASFDEDVPVTLGRLALELIRGPSRRRELASAGREAVLERFSMDRMQRDLEAVYDEVLARRRTG